MIVVATPPAPPAPMSAHLMVSLTDVEKNAVKATAKASGLSMSAWGRQAITAALTNRSGTHGT